jgi:hypothetical protein
VRGSEVRNFGFAILDFGLRADAINHPNATRQGELQSLARCRLIAQETGEINPKSKTQNPKSRHFCLPIAFGPAFD